MPEAPDQIAFAEVVLDLAVGKTLDYSIPEKWKNDVKIGMRVSVPIRGILRSGYILKLKSTSSISRIQPIGALHSSIDLLTPDLMELALWMARYYIAPLHQVFKTILPAPLREGVKPKEQYVVLRAKTKEELQELCKSCRNRSPSQAAILDVMLLVRKEKLLTELLEEANASRSAVDALVEKGALLLDIVRLDRSPLVGEEYFPTKPKILNPSQKEAFDSIVQTLNQGIYRTHLLHGITGSGKTEVYLQAIDHALKQGKGVIMLVPEIALTTQMIERFRSRFEGHIAILHHRLSKGERHDEWHRIYKGEAPIVIGARSALFSPVKNLGLLIVDEEHESSYKQTEEAPCYHARDVAVLRGHLKKAAVVLGSATPSLESYTNALKGKYILNTLSIRADTARLPHVKIIDMSQDKNKQSHLFSDTLLESIKTRAEKGEQSILFLNRRGYHTALKCEACEETIKCRHCDLTLTFHQHENTLSCHLCGFTTSPPPSCPSCHSLTLKFRGIGTEQVERALHAILPTIRTIRIDADTTKHKGSHQKLIRSFGAGKADVLIGTQMIAKGLHFPEVTLVGILNADHALQIPDFRSSENVFQLITQVAGRSGRGVTPGEVLIQTRLPQHPAIHHATHHDYTSFYNEEIESRKAFHFPPFSHLIKFTLAGPDEEKTLFLLEKFRTHLLQTLPSTYELLPATPAGYAKIKEQYRFQFLLKGPSILTIAPSIEALYASCRFPSRYRLYIDVDPTSTF